MTKPVDFDALNRRYDEEMNNADYGDITDEELRDILANMGPTPEAYKKIGPENFFD